MSTSNRGGAAKKTAASKDSTTNEQGNADPQGPNEPPNGTGNTGPGTGAPAAPESTYRMPATVVQPGENPLEPPSDHDGQVQPEQGHNVSSTDHVYAATGGRTIAGEDFSQFVNAAGKALKASALFDDPDPGKTFVTAATRIYEEFYYPGTTEKCLRLVYAEGRRVPRPQAEKIKQAVADAPTALAEA